MAAGFCRHGMPCPRAVTQLYRPLYLAVVVDSMLHRRSNFEVRRPSLSVDMILSVSAVIGLVTLKLMRIIVYVMGNLSIANYKFCCFWDFSFSTDGPAPVRQTT